MQASKHWWDFPHEFLTAVFKPRNMTIAFNERSTFIRKSVIIIIIIIIIIITYSVQQSPSWEAS